MSELATGRSIPLLLVPTCGEQEILTTTFPELQDAGLAIRLCGFGPVAAAARTAQLIAELRPSEILLAGIAGALSRELCPGEARIFEDVAMYGIGAGSGDTFRTVSELGWAHWTEAGPEGASIRVADTICLQRSDAIGQPSHQLLTVCSAAATAKDVRDRLERFPNALAEDMEGFSVALAGALAGVPVRIIRGISNIAGDRDKSRWRIHDGVRSAGKILMEILN